MTALNAVLAHSRSPILVPIIAHLRLPISDCLLLIAHRFQLIADYWSNIRFRQGGVLLFNTVVQLWRTDRRTTDGQAAINNSTVYRRAIKCEPIGCTESNRIESNGFFSGESPITGQKTSVNEKKRSQPVHGGVPLVDPPRNEQIRREAWVPTRAPRAQHGQGPYWGRWGKGRPLPLLPENFWKFKRCFLGSENRLQKVQI